MDIAATAPATSAAAAVTAIIFIVLGLGFYFVPGIVASMRHVPNQGSVWIINVLLGWTLIGWAVALAMACRSKYQAVMTPYGQQYQMPPPGFRPPGPQPQPYGWQPPQPQVIPQGTFKPGDEIRLHAEGTMETTEVQFPHPPDGYR